MKILLLEDDPNLGLILQEHLTLNGFEVVLCVDGEEGTERFANDTFDLCLVDVMMPRKDGFTFVREVRQTDVDTPMIFLTARSLREDRIAGFKAGCDDYITKPFSVEELLLRIQAVLKRCGKVPHDDMPVVFEIGSFVFDARVQVLRHGDQERRLTARESELLQLLCHHKNQTLERSVALQKIWGDDGYFTGRSMDVYVSKLRKYLADDDRIEILSIHGKGFRLAVRE
jgi:DNA-binding response OmpR family regulator